MKKKALFVSIVLAGVLSLSLAGCASPFGNPYDVSMQIDTEGTVGEWLSGTRGTSTDARRMYEEAKEDGYSGTYVEFLKEIGNVTDDSAGISRAMMSSVDVVAQFERTASVFESSAYQSAGGGVIYSLSRDAGNAYIVTNYHVVYNQSSSGKEKVAHISDDIFLYLYGGERTDGEIPATFVGGSMENDIAVLKVENNQLLKHSDAMAVTAADSDAVTLGERVYAIGFPELKGISVCSGIVSVTSEYINVTSADESKTLKMLEIRTDAPINHGNSGGGLFNADGRLIGIVNARTETEGVENFGYAIPSNLGLAIAQNVIDNSKVNDSKGAMRAMLGITVQAAASEGVYDETTSKAFVREAVVVTQVTFGSASYGKLRVGDRIDSIRINDGEEKAITLNYMVGNELFKVRKGDTVTITVTRSGKTMSFSIVFDSDDYFKLLS